MTKTRGPYKLYKNGEPFTRHGELCIFYDFEYSKSGYTITTFDNLTGSPFIMAFVTKFNLTPDGFEAYCDLTKTTWVAICINNYLYSPADLFDLSN